MGYINGWPACAGIIMAFLALSPGAVLAQDENACEACDRAEELRTQITAMSDVSTPERNTLEAQMADAYAACERRAHDCEELLDRSLTALEGCAPRVHRRLPDPLCERLCEHGDHGEWMPADDQHDHPWCDPADGYRMVGRCTPQVRPRTPRPPRATAPSPTPTPGETRIAELFCGRVDRDSDGVPDMQWMEFEGGRECVPYDNCIAVSNADQSADMDQDGIGDVCDDINDLAHWRALLEEHCLPEHAVGRTTLGDRICREAAAVIDPPDHRPAPLPVIEDQLTAFCTREGDLTRLDADLAHNPHPVCRELARLASEVHRLTREDVALHATDDQLLERGDCHNRGLRAAGLVTEVEAIGDDGTHTVDHVVCAHDCLIEGAVYTPDPDGTGPLRDHCELPDARAPGAPRPEDEQMVLSVGPAFWAAEHLSPTGGVEVSLSVPLGDDDVRVRPWVLAGGTEFGTDGTLVALVGTEVEFQLVDTESVTVSLGVGGYGGGAVSVEDGHNPFATYGGTATARVALGDGPNRFELFGRLTLGGCETQEHSGIRFCAGGGGGIAFRHEW